jgi:hypothetical protein
MYDDIELVPVAAVLVADVVVLVLHDVRRALDLDVPARAERHRLPRGKLEHQLLDEGGDVVVRSDRALPLLDREDLVRHLDPHVGFHLHLTAESYAFARLAARHVAALGRQQCAAALGHLDLAHAARALAAAGGRDEDASLGQGAEQRAARARRDRRCVHAVERNRDVAERHETLPRDEEQPDQRQDDTGEHPDAHHDGGHS